MRLFNHFEAACWLRKRPNIRSQLDSRLELGLPRRTDANDPSSVLEPHAVSSHLSPADIRRDEAQVLPKDPLRTFMRFPRQQYTAIGQLLLLRPPTIRAITARADVADVLRHRCQTVQYDIWPLLFQSRSSR